jgi:molybdenum cofactor cytidylyltransferase
VSVAAILLAAGQSTRFRAGGGNNVSKLVAEFAGRPLVRHVAEAALASRARPVIVVTGHARDEVMAALVGLPVTEVPNPLYASGLASSLKAGIAVLPATARGALVLLGDMPLVGAALLDQLIDAFAERSEAVVPLHEGRRGNPVLIGRVLFPTIAALTGDEGARKIIASAKVAEVGVAGDAVTVDIDTPAALASLAVQAAPDNGRFSTSSSKSPRTPVATMRPIGRRQTGFENK